MLSSDYERIRVRLAAATTARDEGYTVHLTCGGEVHEHAGLYCEACSRKVHYHEVVFVEDVDIERQQAVPVLLEHIAELESQLRQRTEERDHWSLQASRVAADVAAEMLLRDRAPLVVEIRAIPEETRDILVHLCWDEERRAAMSSKPVERTAGEHAQRAREWVQTLPLEKKP